MKLRVSSTPFSISKHVGPTVSCHPSCFTIQTLLCQLFKLPMVRASQPILRMKASGVDLLVRIRFDRPPLHPSSTISLSNFSLVTVQISYQAHRVSQNQYQIRSWALRASAYDFHQPRSLTELTAVFLASSLPTTIPAISCILNVFKYVNF